ncbi:hypothetical protein WDU94_005265 [Cyamophila willieti]
MNGADDKCRPRLNGKRQRRRLDRVNSRILPLIKQRMSYKYEKTTPEEDENPTNEDQKNTTLEKNENSKQSPNPTNKDKDRRPSTTRITSETRIQHEEKTSPEQTPLKNKKPVDYKEPFNENLGEGPSRRPDTTPENDYNPPVITTLESDDAIESEPPLTHPLESKIGIHNPEPTYVSKNALRNESYLGIHNPAPTPRSLTSPTLDMIEELYLSQKEDMMTLDILLAASEELKKMINARKQYEIYELNHLINHMTSAIGLKFDNIDKSTVVAILMDIRKNFESPDVCHNEMIRTLLKTLD